MIRNQGLTVEIRPDTTVGEISKASRRGTGASESLTGTTKRSWGHIWRAIGSISGVGAGVAIGQRGQKSEKVAMK